MLQIIHTIKRVPPESEEKKAAIESMLKNRFPLAITIAHVVYSFAAFLAIICLAVAYSGMFGDFFVTIV